MTKLWLNAVKLRKIVLSPRILEKGRIRGLPGWASGRVLMV